MLSVDCFRGSADVQTSGMRLWTCPWRVTRVPYALQNTRKVRYITEMSCHAISHGKQCFTKDIRRFAELYKLGWSINVCWGLSCFLWARLLADTETHMWLGACASVSYFRLKLASRITSSFSPGPSRWASVSAGLLPAWHSAALSETVCIISLWSFLRDWCISIESLIYMVWLQIKKMDFVLARCNHSWATMFETKFVKWSVVYLLSDINLCLHHWDALFLVKKIPFLWI